MRDDATSDDGPPVSAGGHPGSDENKTSRDEDTEGDQSRTDLPPPLFDDSITGEIATLIDDGRTYAQAEIAFQKIRAKLAGKHIAIALACAIVAIVLLHIAFLALAVGLVIALAPLVTIWGAIAIVVGALLVGVLALGLKAKSSGTRLAGLFASSDEEKAS